MWKDRFRVSGTQSDTVVESVVRKYRVDETVPSNVNILHNSIVVPSSTMFKHREAQFGLACVYEIIPSAALCRQ